MNLSVNQLAFERNDEFLFQHINFLLNAGDILQITGANGSGKTTLLRILAGLIEPQVGDVLWKNISIQKQFDTYLQQVHYLGHKNAVKPNLTVLENIKLAHALKSLIPLTNLTEVLKQTNLLHLTDRLALQLSAGQLRRLSLSKLLFNARPLWILDEPTTALDQEGQELLIAMLNQHVHQGGIAVIATHQKLTVGTQFLDLNSLRTKA